MYTPFGAGILVGPRATFSEGDPFLAGGGAVELVDLDESLAASPVRLTPSRRAWLVVDITAVDVVENHVVHLRFEDGPERTVDLAPYLRGPVFERVRRDPDFFASVRVERDAGTIGWPDGADLAPDVRYAGRASGRVRTPKLALDRHPALGCATS